MDSHTLIIGGTGSGKTVTAKGEVEYMLAQGRHVCIVDPTGVWHGLRTMADGETHGYSIPIFGGLRGDVPILPEQGGAVGEIISSGLSGIIDLSEMDSGEQQQFVLDLIAALRKKPRGHFQLIVDEADEFAPETSPSKTGEACKRQMIWLAKRGRTQGFVLTCITQRPADIAKSVISQVETLFAHRLMGPNDQAALRSWLKSHADKATLDKVMSSLASLATGERWLYAPQEGLLERGFSAMPATFDSSRTPLPGEVVREAKTMADLDLGEIRAKLAPQDKHEGPVCVSAQVSDSQMSAELGQLRERVAELEAREFKWVIDTSYGQMQLNSLIAERDELRRLFDAFQVSVARVSIALADEIPAQGGGGPEGDEGQTEGRQVMMSAAPRVEPQRQRQKPPGVTAGETALNQAGSKMLDMLDRIAPSKVTWPSLAAMCSYKPRGGNFNAARKALRESGRLVEDGDFIRSNAPTAGGMTRDGARQLWKEVLQSPAPAMLDALAIRPMSKLDLAEFMGKAPHGGHWNNGIAQLVRNGVIVERAGVMHLAEPLPGESVR